MEAVRRMRSGLIAVLAAMGAMTTSAQLATDAASIEEASLRFRAPQATQTQWYAPRTFTGLGRGRPTPSRRKRRNPKHAARRARHARAARR